MASGQGPLCPPVSFLQQQLSEAEPTAARPLHPMGSALFPGVPPLFWGPCGAQRLPWVPAAPVGAADRCWERSRWHFGSEAVPAGGHFVLSLLLSEPIKQEEKLKHAFCHQAAAAQVAGWELGAQRAPETPWEKSAPASPTPKPAAGVTRGDMGWGRCGMQSADTGFGDILSRGCSGTTPVCPLGTGRSRW